MKSQRWAPPAPPGCPSSGLTLAGAAGVELIEQRGAGGALDERLIRARSFGSVNVSTHGSIGTSPGTSAGCNAICVDGGGAAVDRPTVTGSASSTRPRRRPEQRLAGAAQSHDPTSPGRAFARQCEPGQGLAPDIGFRYPLPPGVAHGRFPRFPPSSTPHAMRTGAERPPVNSKPSSSRRQNAFIRSRRTNSVKQAAVRRMADDGTRRDVDLRRAPPGQRFQVVFGDLAPSAPSTDSSDTQRPRGRLGCCVPPIPKPGCTEPN